MYLQPAGAVGRCPRFPVHRAHLFLSLESGGVVGATESRVRVVQDAL